MTALRKLLDRIWLLVNIVLFAAMTVMIVLVFTNVVLRYGFSSSLLASAEISRFLFVWVIMLGAVLCLRDGMHLDLRIIDSLLPAGANWVLRRLVNAVIFVASAMLFLGSVRQTISNWPNASPISGIPVGVLYLAGAVAGAMMALMAAYRFFVSGSEPRPDGKEAGE